MNASRMVIAACAGLLTVSCASDRADVVTSDPTGTRAPATTAGNGAVPAAPSGTSDDTVRGAPPDPASMELTEFAAVEAALNLTYRAGDPALYVVSKLGRVFAFRDGVAAPVLDISRDVSTGYEQGLLGLTFSLDSNLAYLNYTNRDGDTEIVEYAVSPDGTFDRATRRRLLTIAQPYPNHNGGQVRVGLDGYLYIGTGDGGSADDPERRSLDLGDLLGKMLRIDPAARGSSPYTVPADNPFVGTDGVRPEIWSIGLRNPWRFSFDLVTNDLWIADVGQGQSEEIDVAWADEGLGRAANFGWSAFEGTHRFNQDQPVVGVTPPIYEYLHGARGCSVSGGVRYRGSSLPALYGYYVYADYCSGEVRALEIRDDRTAGIEIILEEKLRGPAEVAQGPDGELYVLSVEDGIVYALTPSPASG